MKQILYIFKDKMEEILTYPEQMVSQNTGEKDRYILGVSSLLYTKVQKAVRNSSIWL